MPELPEVETVRQALDKEFQKPAVIEKIQLLRKDLRVPFPNGLAAKLRGERLLAVRRRAKYLLLDTENHTLISHLGMTGSWRWVQSNEKMKHDHCYVELQDGRLLAYHDPRRFGFFDLVSRGQELKSSWIKHLGFEPLFPECTAPALHKKAKGRQVPIKNFIMDQKVIVGVGNIYASEALFLSGIRPLKKTLKLKLTDWEKLLSAIRKVLSESIENKGTTLRDYVQPDGNSGQFQQKLFVYDRGGHLCRRCHTKIRSKRLAGRSTYWCDGCQK